MSYRKKVNSRSHAAALLMAVLGGAVVAALGLVILLTMDTPELWSVVSAFWFTLLFAFPVVLFLAVVVGLPLTIFLAKQRMEGPVVYPAFGFGIGFFFLPTVMTALGGLPGPEETPVVLILGLLGGVPGLFTAAIWWLAYRRHADAEHWP